MIDYLTEKLTEVQTLLLAGLAVLVIWAVATVFLKTRALIPTAVMLVVGGLVLWGTANSDWFAEKIGEEASLGDQTIVVPFAAALPFEGLTAPDGQPTGWA